MIETWTTAKIEDIAEINPRLPKGALSGEIPVSFVPMAAVGAGDGSINASETRPYSTVQKGFTTFKEGDVLFAKITPCMENGKMAVVPRVYNEYGFGSTEFHVLRPGPGMETCYLYYFVSSMRFRVDAEHNMTGAVGQRRVPTPYLAGCEIPLPPRNEQKRIVAKLEELFSELDKGIESLKTAREQLKVYRQALLKHAFEGKLTAAWREENKDKLETAEELMKRIQAERDSVRGGSRTAPTKRRKDLPPLTAEELAELPVLPEGWGWVKLASVARVLSGYAFKSDDFRATGVPGSKIANVGYSEFVDKDQQFLDKSFLKICKDFIVMPDDLLLALTRPITNNRTKVCKYPKDSSLALLNQRVAAFKELQINSQFLYTYCGTSFFKEWIRSKFSETLQPNLSPKDLEDSPVPLCAPPEQEQLILEIESRLSEVDQLAQTITTTLQQSETLRQSILKKAFLGQLAPQDSHDEPASELLSRIRAEKSAQEKQKRVPARRKRVSAETE